MKTGLFAALLLCAALSHAEGIQQVGFTEYVEKVNALSARCKEEGKPSFSGFCTSREYGSASYDKPTRTSIGMGLEISAFEHFYASCEHTEIASVETKLAAARSVLDAGKFADEMRPQKEALQNYAGRFYFCKSKQENDATIAARLKWFDYMIAQYSESRAAQESQPSRLVSSGKSPTSIVECILAKYKGDGSDFFADGLRGPEGSIIVALLAPTQLRLAIVKPMSDGSVTEFLNTRFEQYKSLPKAADFTNAVIACQ